MLALPVRSQDKATNPQGGQISYMSKDTKQEQANNLSVEMEYVTIPATDPFTNTPIDPFWCNSTAYAPGTHLVPKAVAEHLNERIKVYLKERMRIHQPNADQKAIHDADNRRAQGVRVTSGADLDTVMAALLR